MKVTVEAQVVETANGKAHLRLKLGDTWYTAEPCNLDDAVLHDATGDTDLPGKACIREHDAFAELLAQQED